MDWVENGDASAEWLSPDDRNIIGDRYDAVIALQPDAFFNLRMPFIDHNVTLTVFERIGDEWRTILQQDFTSLKSAEKEAARFFDTMHNETVYRR